MEFKSVELESSSIFNRQTYVKLSTSDPSAVIRGVDRLLCTDSLLFIVDRTNNKLVSFDYEGSFHNSTLDLIGHAGNEYNHLEDAALDEINQRIYLYCDRPYQMLILDYDLNVKECIPMDELLLEIAMDSVYLYALYPDLANGSEYEIRRYNKKNLRDKPDILIRQDHAIPNTKGMGKILNSRGNDIYTCMPFDNIIYEISGGQIIKEWNIDLGGKWFDYNKCKDLRGMNFFKKNEGMHWYIQNIAASPEIIIFNTNMPEVFEVCLKNKECIAFSRLSNDNDSIPFSQSWFIPTSGIYDVALSIPASQIVDYRNWYEEEGESMPDTPIYSAIMSTTLDDNPILILCSLK